MPYLELVTNIAPAKVASTFSSNAVKSLSRLLVKPERYFWVHVNGDHKIDCYGDANTPCVWANLTSIGSLGPEVNYKIGRELIELISKDFGVPKERITVNFHDVPKHDICTWEFLEEKNQ